MYCMGQTAMTDDPLSDDEIIAEERRRYRRRMTYAVLMSVVIFGLLVAALVVGDHYGVFQRIRAARTADGLVTFLTYFPMLLLVGVWLLFWRQRATYRPPPPSILRKQVDDYQSRQRWMMLMFVPLLFVMCLANARAPTSLTPDAPIKNWFGPLLFSMIAILCTLFVSIGPGFLNRRFHVAINDELSRSLRAKAAKVGYAITMAMLAGSYLVALARPRWIAPALLVGIFAAFTVPALYLTWLEWRASRSD